mmetsp:Transcript_1165/g.2498  ORF Transcript_1165/g.2498 Transcript_1165/m.2498 type:complete len:245 (-) Transcript_1165:209-943(-)
MRVSDALARLGRHGQRTSSSMEQKWCSFWGGHRLLHLRAYLYGSVHRCPRCSHLAGEFGAQWKRCHLIQRKCCSSKVHLLGGKCRTGQQDWQGNRLQQPAAVVSCSSCYSHLSGNGRKVRLRRRFAAEWRPAERRPREFPGPDVPHVPDGDRVGVRSQHAHGRRQGGEQYESTCKIVLSHLGLQLRCLCSRPCTSWALFLSSRVKICTLRQDLFFLRTLMPTGCLVFAAIHSKCSPLLTTHRCS